MENVFSSEAIVRLPRPIRKEEPIVNVKGVMKELASVIAFWAQGAQTHLRLKKKAPSLQTPAQVIKRGLTAPTTSTPTTSTPTSASIVAGKATPAAAQQDPAEAPKKKKKKKKSKFPRRYNCTSFLQFFFVTPVLIVTLDLEDLYVSTIWNLELVVMAKIVTMITLLELRRLKVILILTTMRPN